jgi:outer membrane lipopolysaccharide assembly protein LptE/RlpB
MAQAMSRRLAIIASLVICVAFGGCGYQFGGGEGVIPRDAQTIFVEPFNNRTRDVGIEKELTTAVRVELYRRGRLRLVDQAELADVILSGVVRSLDNQTATVNRYDEVLQLEAHLIVDVNLRRREPNEIVWSDRGIRLSQFYAGSRAAVITTSPAFFSGTLNTDDVRSMTDIQLTETQESQTREQLMTGFARELYQRLMESF